jgi:hypothetical protein
MAAQDLDNLTRMLKQHDDELSEQQTQIVNLERTVAAYRARTRKPVK